MNTRLFCDVHTPVIPVCVQKLRLLPLGGVLQDLALLVEGTVPLAHVTKMLYNIFVCSQLCIFRVCIGVTSTW